MEQQPEEAPAISNDAALPSQNVNTTHENATPSFTNIPQISGGTPSKPELAKPIRQSTPLLEGTTAHSEGTSVPMIDLTDEDDEFEFTVSQQSGETLPRDTETSHSKVKVEPADDFPQRIPLSEDATAPSEDPSVSPTNEDTGLQSAVEDDVTFMDIDDFLQGADQDPFGANNQNLDAVTESIVDKQVPNDAEDVATTAAGEPSFDSGLQISPEPAHQPEIPGQPSSPQSSEEELNLGNSILDSTRPAIGGLQSAEQRAEMLKQQAQMVDIFRTFHGFGASKDGPQNAAESEQDQGPAEDPWAFEAEFEKVQKEYATQMSLGQITPELEVKLLRAEAIYDRKRQELKALLEAKEEISTPNSSRKRKKRNEGSDEEQDKASKKSKKGPRKAGPKAGSQPPKGKKTQQFTRQQRQFNPASGQRSMLEDVNDAQGRAAQPGFQTGNRKDVALKALINNVPPERRRDANKDLSWFKESMKHFTGSQSLKPKDGKWSLVGMKTTLQPHQVISCGYMRSRETGSEEPRGGILGDQMGLGKTVVALANIINGKPSKQGGFNNDPNLPAEDNPQTTLVVVPNALLTQWYREIQVHCEEVSRRNRWGIGTVRVFRDRDHATTSRTDMYNADIVLTTFSDVRQSWPTPSYPEGMSQEQRSAYYRDNFFEKRGLLHRVNFFRIILDEGQHIKNPESQTSQGAFHLRAKHFWVMTGSPMLNGSFDLYAYLFFIRHPLVYPEMTLDTYKSLYGVQKHAKNPAPVPDEILQCMHRFVHSDTLFAARLVTLPKSRQIVIKTKFGPLEKALNDIIEQRFKYRVQTLTQDGDEETKQMNILAFLNMQRQVSSHPLILPTEICDFLEIEDFEKIEKVLHLQEEKANSGERMIKSLREYIQQERARAEEELAEKDQESNETLFVGSLSTGETADRGNRVKQSGHGRKKKKVGQTGGSHGKSVEYASFLDALKKTSNFHIQSQRTTCSKCGRPADRPRKALPCQHYYCNTHLEDLMHDQKVKHPICLYEGCGREIIDNVPMDTTGATFPKWMNEKGEVFPSAKTLAVKSQILEWLYNPITGDPNHKIIVFTLWRGMLEILSRVFKNEGWKYTTLHGGLSQRARDENIAMFKDEPSVRLLVATLYTGGTGLNLTAASKCILVEPFWHSGGEDQAFARIFRIGQLKETDFAKIIVKGSVDDRLMNIQRKKDMDIGQVLKDHKTHQLKNLAEMLVAEIEEDGNKEGTDSDCDSD